MSDNKVKESVAGMVYSYTATKLTYIDEISKTGYGRGFLANIRRGVGRQPGEIPELWGILLDGMPEAMQTKSYEPSRAEWAVYIALTLYAIHQQSLDTGSDQMYVPGVSLGTAAAKLAKAEDSKEKVLDRLNQIAIASEITGLENHLRAFVHLLKNQRIGLDYGMLSRDLFLFQSESYVKEIRLKWGRDFFKEIDIKQ